MSNGKAENIIDEVRSIGKDAQALAAEIQPRAQQGEDLSAAELQKIDAMVKRAENAMSTAKVQSKKRREAQIAELENLVNSINLSLGTPGLSSKVRSDLKKLKRNKLAQLTRLRTRAALDFGGILSAAEIMDITRVLKEANAAVAKKKKAAAFLGSLLSIANLAISIAGKAAKLV